MSSPLLIKVQIPAGETPNGDWIVKGDGPAQYDFYRKWGEDDPNSAIDDLRLEGDTLYLTAEAKAAFPNWIDHFDTFDIEWSLSTDNGGSWQEVGTTENQVYTLLEAPTSTLYHTVAHIATAPPVKGLSNPAAVANKIWDEFSDNIVRRVDGEPLSYDPGMPGHGAQTPLADENGRGQCSALADLLVHVLHAHAIDANIRTIDPPGGLHGFVIKDHRALGPKHLELPETGFAWHAVVVTQALPDVLLDPSLGTKTQIQNEPTVEEWSAPRNLIHLL